MPGGPGKSSKPLRFLGGGRGFVELLRLEAGTVMPLHRHTGDVHAYNLQGSRVLCTGELIEHGQYVYEPPGNTDSWQAVGEEPLVVLVVVTGDVEYLDARQRVKLRVNAATQWEAYQQHCLAHGLSPEDLVD